MNKKYSELAELFRSEKTDEEILDFLLNYHKNDIADMMAGMTEEERKRLYHLLGAQKVAEIFKYIEEPRKYIRELSVESAARVISEMDSDDAVDLLEDLDPEEKEQIVRMLDEDAKKDVKMLLSYDGCFRWSHRFEGFDPGKRKYTSGRSGVEILSLCDRS